MKRPPLLIISDKDMSWPSPPWREQVINSLKSAGKIIGKIFSWMALPFLIAVLYAMLWPLKYPAEKPKYTEMTTVELLDYYQAKAQEFKNGRK